MSSGPPSHSEPCFDAARMIRAVRRDRVLSQRELAAAAGVTPKTVASIEAGERNPGIATIDRLVRAAGCRLAVLGPDGQLATDDVHDAIRDRGGRRFPAHLKWGGKPDYLSQERWWGWHRITWYFNDDPIVPDHVYWQRLRPPSEGEWRYHRWHGWYRARVANQPGRAGQSRPSEGPPEPPPA